MYVRTPPGLITVFFLGSLDTTQNIVPGARVSTRKTRGRAVGQETMVKIILSTGYGPLGATLAPVLSRLLTACCL